MVLTLKLYNIMELFDFKLDYVLTLPELSKMASSEILPSSDIDFVANNYGFELASYIEFLSSQPELYYFIATFNGRPYNEDKLRAYYYATYPNKGRAMLEFRRNRLEDTSTGKYFKGWELVKQEDLGIEISNGKDNLQFVYLMGKSPTVICNGTKVVSIQHLLSCLTQKLLYK